MPKFGHFKRSKMEFSTFSYSFSDFIHGKNGEVGCPKGYKPVKDIATCKTAAADYLKRPFRTLDCQKYSAVACFSDASYSYFSTCVKESVHAHVPVCTRDRMYLIQPYFFNFASM